MDRRESLKNLLLGAAATGALFQAAGYESPATETTTETTSPAEQYPFSGTRTVSELNRDARFHAVPFFNAGEQQTLDVLADLILPADEQGPAASTTGTTEFIGFMANDYPDFQLPLRAGLAWLSAESLHRFGNNDFTQLQAGQQTAILDEIAYLPADKTEELTAPVAFFDLLRKLVLTGYFTSKEGMADLGYQGNQPNVWEGVPDEVLAKHGLSYEAELLPKYVDQEKRADIARWDDQGNLLT